MGPISQLFARIQSMPPAEREIALARMADDGGPITLGGPPSIQGFYDEQLPQRQPVDEYVSRPPMAFRDPAQAGPSPPSDGPIASLYKKGKK